MAGELNLFVAGVDVTQFVRSLTWSGNYQNCARELSARLIQSHADPYLKVLCTEVASPVTFAIDGKTVFLGYIITEERSTDDTTVTIDCYDKGFYLNQNYLVRQYTGSTAAAITSDVCGELGLSPGSMAEDGSSLSRNFLRGVTGYQIIQTAWNMTGKKVCIRFEGENLVVKELKQDAETVVIKKASNLLSASAKNSIKGAVTRVALYDKEGKFLSNVDGDVATYGVLQKVMIQSDNEDKTAEAQKELDENGYKQTMTVNCLGDVRLITGNTVIVEEPYTGISGLFWIIEDKHEFTGGVWNTRLLLSFEQLTNDTMAGTEVE